MKIQFSTYEIESVLNRLGMNWEKKGGRYWTLCPNPTHNDTVAKNFSVKENGSSKCYACGFSGNLIHITRAKTGMKFGEALEFVGKDKDSILSEALRLDTNYKKEKPTQFKIKKESKFFIRPSELHTITDEFISTNPYLSARGYTSEFCNHYGIKLCKSTSKWTEKYDGYIIIPLPELNSFEARNIYRENGRDKVLYPYGCDNNSILFDLTNLRNEDLIFTEGTGTLPKLYRSGRRNITSIFGKEVTEKQLDLLNSIKGRKIIIMDDDKYGLELVHNLSGVLKNFHVYDLPRGINDESPEFERLLDECEILPSIQYLSKYYGLFE